MLGLFFGVVCARVRYGMLAGVGLVYALHARRERGERRGGGCNGAMVWYTGVQWSDGMVYWGIYCISILRVVLWKKSTQVA